MYHHTMSTLHSLSQSSSHYDRSTSIPPTVSLNTSIQTENTATVTNNNAHAQSQSGKYEYNGTLAQRQAEVRAALQDLYGENTGAFEQPQLPGSVAVSSPRMKSRTNTHTGNINSNGSSIPINLNQSAYSDSGFERHDRQHNSVYHGSGNVIGHGQEYDYSNEIGTHVEYNAVMNSQERMEQNRNHNHNHNYNHSNDMNGNDRFENGNQNANGDGDADADADGSDSLSTFSLSILCGSNASGGDYFSADVDPTFTLDNERSQPHSRVPLQSNAKSPMGDAEQMYSNRQASRANGTTADVAGVGVGVGSTTFTPTSTKSKSTSLTTYEDNRNRNRSREHTINDDPNHHHQIQGLHEKINSLETQNENLQEELDLLKDANQVLAAQPQKASQNDIQSPTKYQVELESMRIVADQVQAEAEEKIALVEKEKEDLRLQLEQEQMRNHGGVGRSRGGSDGNSGKAWRKNFYSLLEQICLLEESGLRKDASLRMDQVVMDALRDGHMQSDKGDDRHSPSRGVDHVNGNVDLQREHDGEMKEYLDRLAKGCGSSNVIDSIVSDEEATGNVSVDRNKLASPSLSTYNKSAGEREFISVSVGTEDLRDLHPTPTSSSSSPTALANLRERLSELQLENASLKGSNEQMKEQILRHKQEIQSLKASSGAGGALSPSFSTASNSDGYNINSNALKQSNAKFRREIQILTEGQRMAEEENQRIVQRCVDLENVAEDATIECEGLMSKLALVEEELRAVKEERDEYLTLYGDYEEATNKQELELRKVRKELNADLDALKGKCDGLVESKNVLEKEANSLRLASDKLASELEDAQRVIEEQSKKISLHGSELTRVQQSRPEETERICQLEEECQALKRERDTLEGQLGELQDIKKVMKERDEASVRLEDECGRLRNINGMIRAKIELTKAELRKVKDYNSSILKQLSSLRSEYETMRIENVSLSDSKSDMQVELSKYERQCTEHRTLVTRVEKELGEVISNKDDLEKQKDELSEELSSERDLLKDANIEIQKMNKDNEDLKSSLQKIFSENNVLKDKVNEMELRMKSEKRVVFQEDVSLNQSNNLGKSPLHLRAYELRGSVGVQTPETASDHPDVCDHASPSNEVTPANNTLSLVQSTLFESSSKSLSKPCLAFTPGGDAGSLQAIDDQLERIKFAKERAMRTLKSVSNMQSKKGKYAEDIVQRGSPSEKPTPTPKKSSIDETEAFVNSILKNCGKQKI